MKNQNLAQNKTLAVPMHKNSHSIAKTKAKIRVVHLQTPEVIDIEPADFQKFAQSLTGKFVETDTKHNKPQSSRKDVSVILCDESSSTEVGTCPKDNFGTSHKEGFAYNCGSKVTCEKKENLSRKTTLALAMHKGSHSIENTKPRVRITHISKPEAMDIEPADFQKVVQSLTGKASAFRTELQKPEYSSKEMPIILCDEPSSSTETNILNEFRSCLEYSDGKPTDEEELSSWENLSDGSFLGLEDMDNFINELIDFDSFLQIETQNL